MKRLAHPHEDDVGDAPVARLEFAREKPGLIEDFARRQVAIKPGLPGRTKRAGKRASGLRREAERRATAIMFHQHGLDFFAVVQAKETFRRLPVLRPLQHDGLDGRKHNAARDERFAQLFRQRRHLAGSAEQLFGGRAIELAQAGTASGQSAQRRSPHRQSRRAVTTSRSQISKASRLTRRAPLEGHVGVFDDSGKREKEVRRVLCGWL